MAFIVDPNDPNAPNNQNPADQQAPISSGGAGIGGATKPGNTPGVNVPAQPSAQLSAYLKANQPQAEAFGQNIAQTVGGQVNAAGASINPAVNTYTGNLYSVPNDPTINSAVAASPSGLSAEQAATYKKQLGAAASSPNAANTFETTQGYQDAAGKVQGAVEQADLWNSGNNVSNLTAALSPFEGPNATQGDRTLDSLLLSRTPTAYSGIQAAVAPAASFQDQLAAGTSSANDALHSTIAQNQATTDASQAAAKTYATGLNSTLAKYLADAQKQVLDYNGKINPLAQNVANVQPQIAALQNAVDAYNQILAGGAATTGVGDLTSNFAPISYGQVGNVPGVATMPDVSQLASSGQYTDLAALRELLGPDYFSSLNTSINPEQASLAGTWTPESDATLPSLQSLLDPLTSPAIQGLTPNWLAMQQFAPLVQGSAPISSGLKGIDSSLDALLTAAGQQPWVGPGGTPAPAPAPTPGATPPSQGPNGEPIPGNEAWFNDLWAQYPEGISGMPRTYAEYLQQYNAGGIHIL